jgi:cytochrome bd-type quinol oxidase subunit 2
MEKKTMKTLYVTAGVVAVAVIAYVLWMYVFMDPSQMSNM